MVNLNKLLRVFNKKEILGEVSEKDLFEHKYFKQPKQTVIDEIADLIDVSPPPFFAYENYDKKQYVIVNDPQLKQELDECETELAAYVLLTQKVKPKYVNMCFYLYSLCREVQIEEEADTEEEAPPKSALQVYLDKNSVNSFNLQLYEEFLAESNYQVPDIQGFVTVAKNVELAIDELQLKGYVCQSVVGAQTYYEVTSSCITLDDLQQIIDMGYYFNLYANETFKTGEQKMRSRLQSTSRPTSAPFVERVTSGTLETFNTGMIWLKKIKYSAFLHSTFGTDLGLGELLATVEQFNENAPAMIIGGIGTIGGYIAGSIWSVDVPYDEIIKIPEQVIIRDQFISGQGIMQLKTVKEAVVKVIPKTKKVNGFIYGMQKIGSGFQKLFQLFKTIIDVTLWGLGIAVGPVATALKEDPITTGVLVTMILAYTFDMIYQWMNAYSRIKLVETTNKTWIIINEEMEKQLGIIPVPVGIMPYFDNTLNMIKYLFNYDKLVGVTMPSFGNSTFDDTRPTSTLTKKNYRNSTMNFINYYELYSWAMSLFSFGASLLFNKKKWDYNEMKNITKPTLLLYNKVYELVRKTRLSDFKPEDFKTLKLFDTLGHTGAWHVGKSTAEQLKQQVELAFSRIPPVISPIVIPIIPIIPSAQPDPLAGLNQQLAKSKDWIEFKQHTTFLTEVEIKEIENKWKKF